MSNPPLRVLFLSSEVAPFSKTGGLADVSSALPAALARLGCDVRILTPRYGSIDCERFGIQRLDDVPEVEIELRGRAIRAGFSAAPEVPGLPLACFVECDPLFHRPGIYVDPLTGRDYIDNDYRYILLSRAAIELCRAWGWIPDILHCNDWQTGPAAYYLHELRRENGWERTRSLVTIHNIAYLGMFGPETVGRIGRRTEHYFRHGGPLELYGHVSFLKMGLEFGDAINTVSPTYAREIQSDPEFGYGLETMLRERGVAGIINGLDVDVWNPATDSYIAQNYTAGTLERKAENKRVLAEKSELPHDGAVPLIGMISRIVSQKGFEILAPVVREILALPARMVLLGSGDPQLEHVFLEYGRRYPEQIHVRIGYDDALAHLIEAGADLFLMPSKYEPCGLNQMMSMRYGTPPIVRETGGLADTVLDADDDPERGTGFSFIGYDPGSLLQAVRRAVAAYQDPARWRHIQRNAMAQDFSWDHSASLYYDLYQKTLRQPPRVLV